MWQVLFTVPMIGVKVYGYGLMLFLAMLASMHVAAWSARRRGLDPEVIYDLALYVFVGGLVGARVFYVVQYWGNRVNSLADIFRFWEGGIVLYGSIIGGTATFFAYRAWRPFPLRPALDAVAPGLAVGVAIGRVGCFLNGCCYGDVCRLPWAVAFPEPSPPWQAHRLAHLIGTQAHWSLPVHPTQLYSVVDGLLLLGLLLAFDRFRRRDGEVMALLMVTYPVTRFLIEHLRGDEAALFLGMTVSQTISVALLVFGAAFWARLILDEPRERHGQPVAVSQERSVPVGAR
jgi:phosphatidylglycerol:prolipoprotein diacylglycerol transferase